MRGRRGHPAAVRTHSRVFRKAETYLQSAVCIVYGAGGVLIRTPLHRDALGSMSNESPIVNANSTHHMILEMLTNTREFSHERHSSSGKDVLGTDTAVK